MNPTREDIRELSSRRVPGLRWSLAFAGALTAASPGGLAHAATSTEYKPEFDAYIKLDETSRIQLVADVAYDTPAHTSTGELGIHLDYTLKPILRPRLREGNWERDRYLWLRFGYERYDSLDNKSPATRENRGILEATVRVELPHAVWLVNRFHTDYRDVAGKPSYWQYRYRLGAEKEFVAENGVAFVPFADVEWLYSTKEDAWSKITYRAGVDVEISKAWRVEPYYARDDDRRPSPAKAVNRLGLIVKYYH